MAYQALNMLLWYPTRISMTFKHATVTSIYMPSQYDTDAHPHHHPYGPKPIPIASHRTSKPPYIWPLNMLL